jgi:hypothetical protein
MLEIGKARKSLPIRLAAVNCSSVTERCPVGRLSPAVITTKSLPRVRLPRTWVSVSPSTWLTPADDTTRARA